MGLFGVFLLCCGVFGIACGSKCVAGTAKCSQYWVKLETHKHLLESEEKLDAWCKQQPPFYECLESILLAGKNGSLTELPTNLVISKLFAEDLCTETSTSRRRYLNNAACINQLNTELCTEPEFIDIVTDDGMPSRCSPSEKIHACIAATMIMNCGFDAGRVYRNLLKITRYSDEVCDIEMSPGVDSCKGRDTPDPKMDEQISGIYYELVDRIGSIPEQEIVHSAPLVSHEVSEFEEIDEIEVITEAIKTALDVLDQDVLSDEAAVETSESDDEVFKVVPYPVPKDYKKYPLITQVYRDILFYNYSGLEYTIYWRQPAFNIFENLTCEHLQPSFLRGIIFRCIQEYRSRDPDCVSNATVHEPVTPELIRDLDPEVLHDSIVEFGPRPDWIQEMDEASEQKRLREQLKSTTMSPDEYVVTGNSVFSTTSATLLKIAETITKSPLPEWLQLNQTFILPDDILKELMELVPPPEDFVPPPHNMFQIGNTMYNFIYDPITNSVENFTCSRMDECHPRAKGLFKCKAIRRKIQLCDVCYGGTGANIEGLPPTWAPHSVQQKYAFQVSETTEPAETPDGSGLEQTSGEETIALVFSGDIETEIEKSGKHEPIPTEVGVDESNYVTDQALDSEELEDSESEDDSSTVRLVVLDQNSIENRIGDSYVPELLYEIDGMGIVDDEQISDLDVVAGDGYRLLNGNVLVLQTVTPEDDAEEYSIDNTSDEFPECPARNVNV